jgi:hypothetical protein
MTDTEQKQNFNMTDTEHRIGVKIKNKKEKMNNI